MLFSSLPRQNISIAVSSRVLRVVALPRRIIDDARWSRDICGRGWVFEAAESSTLMVMSVEARSRNVLYLAVVGVAPVDALAVELHDELAEGEGACCADRDPP
jgi:hypothetical protein